MATLQFGLRRSLILIGVDGSKTSAAVILRRPLHLVVLPDQRLRVGADGARDAADVAASVEVATARRVVTALNPPDDRLPDTGPLANLRNGETSLATCLCQGVTDAHAAPPLLCPTAHRPGVR